MAELTRRRLLTTAVSAGAALAVASRLQAQKATRGTLAKTGWCWDGQAFCLGTPTSIFGTGEGTRWFGLKRVCHMFHPNTELALEKLRDFDEVLCEISKWKIRRAAGSAEDCGVESYHDGTIATKRAEAAVVNSLAGKFRNIRGAIDDDLFGKIRREKIRPEEYGTVYHALKQGKPNLQLWCIVYTHELAKENWQGFAPFMDVINLCVTRQCENFGELDRYLDQCREIFPGKPVNLIYRLTDYRPAGSPPPPVPLDLLQSHWNDINKYLQQGRLAGYSILGGFLIDLYPEQAKWIREFIRSH